jgi:hypothetical protein
MKRRIGSENIHATPIDFIEEMRAQDDIKTMSSRGTGVNVHVHGSEPVLGDVPGRSRRINEVRREAQHVRREETPGKHGQELHLADEKKKECRAKVFGDKNQISKTANQIENGRNVLRPILVRSQAMNSKPLFVAEVGSRNVDVTGDPLPIKISHGIEHGARQNEGEEVLEKGAGAIVVAIQQTKKPDVNMVGTQATEYANGGDIAQPYQERPQSQAKVFLGKQPEKQGVFFCLRHPPRGKRWSMQFQEISKYLAISAVCFLAGNQAFANCFDFSTPITEPMRAPVSKDESGKLPDSNPGDKPGETWDWAGVHALVNQPLDAILQDLLAHRSTKSSRVNHMDIRALPDPRYLAKQEVSFEVDPFPLIKVKWKEIWGFMVTQGTRENPERVVISYEKTDGTSHISHLCGNYVLEKKDDASTDIFIYEEAKATGREEKDTLNGLKGNMESFRRMPAHGSQSR